MKAPLWEKMSDRNYDEFSCICTETCLRREEETHDRCTGSFGDEPCQCKACGALAAEQYADGQYQ